MKTANQLPAVSRIQSARFIHHLTALLIFALCAFAVPASHAQTAATVVRVSAPDGFYQDGDTVLVTVEFTEAVTVTEGSTPTGRIPRLVIINHGVTFNAFTLAYGSGSGTTSLVFPYEVTGSDETRDLRYFNTESLVTGSGTIQNVGTTTNADLTLPTPGSANSLSGSSDVVLDNTAPVFPAPRRCHYQ